MITGEIEKILGALPAFRKMIGMFALRRHEVAINNSKDENELIAKSVWFAIPFHIFVMFQVAGGITKTAAAIGSSIVSIIVVIMFGSIVALGKLHSWDDADYEKRSVQWSIVILVTWTFTIVLVAIGYFVGGHLLDLPNDILAEAFKRLSILRLANYPSFNLDTWLVYFVYGILGAGFATILAQKAKGAKFKDALFVIVAARNVMPFISVSIVISFILLGSLTLTK